MLFSLYSFMKKIISITFLASLIYGISYSQNLYSSGAGGAMLYLKPMKSEGPKGLKRGSYVGEHVLGDTVSQLLNTFEKTYVYYKKSSGAYPVEEKVVLKTPVYKKVKTFDSYITKKYQEDEIKSGEASSRLQKVLTTAIKLMNYDTKQVEKDIKKIAEPEDVEKYLNNIVFN